MQKLANNREVARKYFEDIVNKSSLDAQVLCNEPSFYLPRHGDIPEELREPRKDPKFGIDEENNVTILT
ncbi:hypothetical protein NPIL_337881 [Nephila pilipes]|uniref:Uncharacterized protein n=1 Tax=Nephila pilipes TaxID=299642 RepID=A0A8X6PZ81_NEPPI|nr:hypothetical protein NPIL_337881 [Nephila pilipes]